MHMLDPSAEIPKPGLMGFLPENIARELLRKWKRLTHS